MCSKEVKLLILNEIDKNKNILFGFDAGRNEKAIIWQNIFHKAWLQGAYQNKTWKYIRDATWPSIKKCALTKLKKSKGKQANCNNEMTDIDTKVLEIISTPVIKDEPGFIDEQSQDESTVSSSRLLKPVGESPQRNVIAVSNNNTFAIQPTNKMCIQPSTNISQMKGLRPRGPIFKPIIKKERRYTVQNRRPIIIHDEELPSTSNFVEESNSSEIEEEASESKEDITFNANKDVTSYPESKRMKRAKHNKMAELKCEKLKLEIEILKENKSMCEIGIENKRIEKKILSLQLIKLENELGIRMSRRDE